MGFIITFFLGKTPITNQLYLVKVMYIKATIFQNWEDLMDASLSYLLRSVLAKSDKDKLRTAQMSFEEVKDVSRLEKHYFQVIERINKKETSEFEQKGIY